MRRRDLSADELDQVINLRRAGSTWTKIQGDTGINRRTAKHAYEKWDRSKSIGELKEARKDVAAKALLDHLNSLTILAGAVVANLDVPLFIDHMEKNSAQFFSWLWGEDLLNRASIEVETQEARVAMPRPFLDPQSYRREKELLFESLKEHTREEIRWKDILDTRWKTARDNCAKIVPKLREETGTVVNNFVKQEREMDFLQRIEEESRESHPAEQMTRVVLTSIWERIRQDRLDEEAPWFEMLPRNRGRSYVVYRRPRVEVVLELADKDRAERVTRICELAANNLAKGDIVRHLQNEIRKMRKADEELREALNPVRLRPLILRTRCELCPA